MIQIKLHLYVKCSLAVYKNLLEYSSDSKYLLIICPGYDDSGLGGRCMDNLSITNVECHMSRVADEVTRLCIGQTVYCGALAAVCRGGMRKAYTEVGIYAHYKPGTVSSIRQAGAAIYIRISDKLKRIFCNGFAHIAAFTYRCRNSGRSVGGCGGT